MNGITRAAMNMGMEVSLRFTSNDGVTHTITGKLTSMSFTSSGGNDFPVVDFSMMAISAEQQTAEGADEDTERMTDVHGREVKTKKKQPPPTPPSKARRIIRIK